MGKLIQIQLVDFKSYKGSHTIGPFSDFSAIIGPNGAGKSNLMDAISFVLGIKSSHLRSSHLKDLIYHDGIAQLTTASVSALYKTSDDETITFTRTVLASGSSEFRINHRVVSHGKYIDMLEKQNILVKAKNFLVFQGDVEAVASQSPKDLTRLIEQISGSLELKPEYERLKALHEKTSESSALNFTKKRTMNAEMKQFKEQQQDFERFELLKTKRDKIIQISNLWKLYHLEKKCENINDTIENEYEKSREYKEKCENFQTQLKTQKKSFAKVSKTVLLCEKKLEDKNQEKLHLKPISLNVDEGLNHTTKRIEIAKENLKSTQSNLKEQIKGLNGLRSDLKNIEAAMANHEEKMELESHFKGPALGEKQLVEYKKLRQACDTQTFSEQTRLKHLQRQLESTTETSDRLNSGINIHKERLKSIVVDKNQFGIREKKLQESIDSTMTTLKQNQIKVRDMEGEQRKLYQHEIEINEKLLEISNRLMQARVDQRESDRTQKFKETLETLKRLYPGVLGKIVDLCKPTQRKYDLAVSIVMGKNMDAIVVDTEKTAIECISYMRDQRSGQATFLPLDTINVKAINEKYRSFTKGARLALDVIQFDGNCERAIKYVVGNAIIADSDAIARYICYEKRQEVKVVTLDGTVFHKTGMITGGQGDIESTHSKRWEQKELDELKKRRDAFSEQLQEIAKKKRRAAHDEQLQSETAALESGLSRMQEDLSATVQKIQSFDTEIVYLESQLKKLQADLKKSNDQKQKIEEDIQEVDELIQTVETKTFKKFCQSININSIREYERFHLKTTQKLTEQKLEYSHAKVKLENMIAFDTQRKEDTEKRISGMEQTIKELETKLIGYQQKKKDLASKIGQLDSEYHELSDQLIKAKDQLAIETSRLSEIKLSMTQDTKQYDHIKRNISKKESELEITSAEKVALIRKCKLGEIALPLANQKSLDSIPLEALDLPEGDEMDIDDSQTPLSIKDLEFNYASLSKDLRMNNTEEQAMDFSDKIRDMEAEMEQLAPSLRSIDKLGEVEKRLKETANEFDHSRQEAKEAKEQFEDIKRERYEKFYNAYQYIADHIDKIYKELTKSRTFPLGGTAYLSLEDSDEPYLDGIKYHAMPPMKRFREMELLSGGEKTIVALALLFAIHSYQPSPFFILDEVDAALDNTNVQKMTQYLRSRAGPDFQFIVISLKPLFYEQANSLVGIYRDQNQGTSSTLTLDLTKYD
ncbi:RecF/RecN/SMC [Globomyces pollinis-pini]|nr:RecF/RecN/SMC [Globomyces pollinis-pini]